MFIKIYFNNNPLFLCDDQHDAVIEPYLHHDDAVFIDELSTPAIHSMLHEMQRPTVHAGIFLHHNLEALKKAFWKQFTVVQAAGGLTINEYGDILLIFRRGVWDLPKGKLEKGETPKTGAVREVEEETGLKEIKLEGFLLTTYHTYHEGKKLILKENHWYRMKVEGCPVVTPQLEEDITITQWTKPGQLSEIVKNTFPSIKDVLQTLNVAD